MLLSVINESSVEKYDLIKLGLQCFGMSVPAVGLAPRSAAGGSGNLREGEHYNSEFERHSRSAKETGVPDLSPTMKNALKSIYSKTDKSNAQRITGSLDDFIKNTPEELG